MNVSLTPELERFVNERVASGRYRTASEVVREGLRLLEGQEQERQAQLDALRADLATGIEALDRDEGISGEEAFQQLVARREARRTR